MFTNKTGGTGLRAIIACAVMLSLALCMFAVPAHAAPSQGGKDAIKEIKNLKVTNSERACKVTFQLHDNRAKGLTQSAFTVTYSLDGSAFAPLAYNEFSIDKKNVAYTADAFPRKAQAQELTVRVATGDWSKEASCTIPAIDATQATDPVWYVEAENGRFKMRLNDQAKLFDMKLDDFTVTKENGHNQWEPFKAKELKIEGDWAYLTFDKFSQTQSQQSFAFRVQYLNFTAHKAVLTVDAQATAAGSWSRIGSFIRQIAERYKIQDYLRSYGSR